MIKQISIQYFTIKVRFKRKTKVKKKVKEKPKKVVKGKKYLLNKYYGSLEENYNEKKNLFFEKLYCFFIHIFRKSPGYL